MSYTILTFHLDMFIMKILYDETILMRNKFINKTFEVKVLKKNDYKTQRMRKNHIKYANTCIQKKRKRS